MSERQPAVDCSVFAQQIYHFQADELCEDERRGLQEHLDGCKICARRLSVEQSLLRTLKQRLRPPEASADLKGRVRAALEREAPATLGARWLMRPWLPVLAASILLGVALVGPSLKDRLEVPGGPAAAQSVRQRVTVVDVDCDRVGLSLAEQRRCRHPHHVNALKLADGRYWNLSLARSEARMLALNPHLRGHRLDVRGPLYGHGGAFTLEIDRYEDLGYP